MTTRKTNAISLCPVLLALLLAGTGCDKDKTTDADVDPEYDATGDVWPDVPVDMPVDTLVDGVTDTYDEVIPDVFTDTVAEVPADSSTTCVCGDTGVTLVVVSGCTDWPDATECTGWHSVVDPDGDGEPDSEAPFPDGTELCAYDCCIRLVCP